MKRGQLVAVILLCLAGLLTLIFFRQEMGVVFRASIALVASLGPLGPLLFAAIYVIACVLMLPASVLTLGGGAIWGLWAGAGMVLISATMGAAVTFLIGRHVARGWIESKTKGNPKLAALDAAIGREGWRLVFLTRLSPVIPFNLLNYSLGLTTIQFPGYIAATFAGMIPGVFLYTYLGTLAGQIASAGENDTSALVWGFRLFGLAATALVSIYVARIAKRALNQSIGG